MFYLLGVGYDIEAAMTIWLSEVDKYTFETNTCDRSCNMYAQVGYEMIFHVIHDQ